MDLNELYNSNEEFRDYIDRFCKLNDTTKEIAFEHNIIKNDIAPYCATKKLIN